MGTDCFMDLLRSDLNHLSLGNPVVIERVYSDLDGWYVWACETLAKHGNELEVQAVPRIIGSVRMSGDIAFWRSTCDDPIYVKGDFTKVGERILQTCYINVIRNQIQQYTDRYMARDRRKTLRLLMPQQAGG